MKNTDFACIVSAQSVNLTKFLGVLIDDELLKELVDDICQKISRTNGVMNRLKHIIPRKIMLTLNNTMILPYISYCYIICFVFVPLLFNLSGVTLLCNLESSGLFCVALVIF